MKPQGFSVVKQFSVHSDEDHKNITTAETLEILQHSAGFSTLACLTGSDAILKALSEVIF